MQDAEKFGIPRDNILLLFVHPGRGVNNFDGKKRLNETPSICLKSWEFSFSYRIY